MLGEGCATRRNSSELISNFTNWCFGRCAQNLKKFCSKIFHCPCLEGCATRRNSSELISNFTNWCFGRCAQNRLKIILKIFHFFLNTNYTNRTNNFSCLYSRMVAHDLRITRISFGRCAQNLSKIRWGRYAQNRSKIVLKIFQKRILKQ